MRLVGTILLFATALTPCGGPSVVEANDMGSSRAVVLGEVLAVRNQAGKVTQVRLRKPDGRFLRVELDGNGALLGVRHSGSFAEVTGQVYLKEVGTLLVRWIRVHKYRIVDRPPDWVEPELICHEEEDEPDGVDEPDAGETDEEDESEL